MAKATKRRPAPEKPIKTASACSAPRRASCRTSTTRTPALLRKYISERGKIRARRVTGNCVQHQRDIADRGQERPRGRAAAVHLDGSLRNGSTTMKLILTADVDHLGAPGDTVEVKDGYGRNYLLPRGLAIVATRGAEKQVDDIRRAQRSQGRARPRPRQGAQGRHRRPGRRLADRARRPATPASCSARSPRPTSSPPSRRPAARVSTSGPSSCPRRTSRRSASTPVAVRLHPERHRRRCRSTSSPS